MTAAAAQAARQDAIERAGLSPYLTATLRRYDDLAPTFLAGGTAACLDAAARTPADLPVGTALRRERARLSAALALGDLAGELDMVAVTARLSAFADRACDGALEEAVRQTVPGWDRSLAGFAILALGKHGGSELNYSSDIDPILLFDPDTLPRRPRDEPQQAAERIARAWVRLLQERDGDGFVFRVDLRLRPSAEISPPALPVEAAIAHYESAALPWERAAMVRARAAAGDRALGERFLGRIEPFVWRRSLEFGAGDELARLAARIRDTHADDRTSAPGGDLKRGRGGIREAEFFVQAHQLIHGGRHPDLRSPNLLTALAALRAHGLVSDAEAERLDTDYRRLRTVEHRLQMMDDRQTHSLPIDPAELDRVARLDGLADGAALLADLAPVIERVAATFATLQPGTPSGLPFAEGPLRERLTELGFADAEAAARPIAGWRAGTAVALRSASSQAALEDVLPVLLPAFGEAAEPLMALHRFDDLVRRLPSAVNLFRLLQANPPLARLLADVIAAAPTLGDELARRPGLLDRLLDASAFDPLPDAAELSERWDAELATLDQEAALDRLREHVSEERFALGVQLIAGSRPSGALSRDHAHLAEASVIVAHHLAAREYARRQGEVPGASLVVVALGRLGGGALTPASDLDLVLLHSGEGGARSDGATGHDATIYFNRLGQRLVAALSVPTAAGPLYDVDTRLRPSGADGPLVPSISAFLRYGLENAWTWERMAFTRARVISGSDAAQGEARAAIDAILRPRGDGDRVREDALAMRARMAEAKPASGPLDVKLLPGGLVDLEFIVHVEQLTTGKGLRASLEDAVAALVAAGRLDEELVAVARTLGDLLFVLRLTAPDGRFASRSARALTERACHLVEADEIEATVLHARAAVGRQWHRTFGVMRDGLDDG